MRERLRAMPARLRNNDLGGSPREFSFSEAWGQTRDELARRPRELEQLAVSVIDVADNGDDEATVWYEVAIGAQVLPNLASARTVRQDGKWYFMAARACPWLLPGLENVAFALDP